MEIANISTAKANLSALVKKALAGEEVFISRANEVLVRLTPVTQDVSPRVGGFWEGQVKIIGDWDESDREIQAMFEVSTIYPHAKP